MRVDLAFVDGTAFLPPGRPVPGTTVGVSGDTIVAITTDPGELSADRIVEMGGRLLLPGFQDAHVHPIHGGMRRLRCDLTDIGDLDEALDRIRTVASSGVEWVLGGGWSFAWFDRGCPPADLLDRLTGEVPAYLVVRDGHSAWANHAALARAGIHAGTPDPPDGRIERLPDGSPQGTLHEGAMDLVARVTPAPSPALMEEALEEGQRVLFSHGLTAWQDAWIAEAEHRAYRSLAEDGRLAAQVRGAIWWDRARGIEQLEDIRRMAGEGIGGYRPAAVKLMLDGVIENFTASLLDPYVGDHGEGPDHRGIDFIDPDSLGPIVAALEEAGLQCHFHAIGDRAVRSALDAVAFARAQQPDSGLHHHISHLQLVDPHDVPRFAQLGVSANCQTVWACNEPAMTELTIPFLGTERARRQYPFAAIAAGGHLAMGSDWPVSTPDVMAQIHVAVTRTPPGDGSVPPLLPEQRLSLAQALLGFTLGSARVNGLESTRGSVAVGKVADLVVLQRDPFEPFVALDEIGVDLTVVGGRVVYDGGQP
jgi:predicted amidohydrolase YtcJ